jgi:hypothetical protein
VAAEVFELDDQVQRSAVFASYLVETFFDPQKVIGTVEALIVAAASRRERAFRRMVGALMQVSFLSEVLAHSELSS